MRPAVDEITTNLEPCIPDNFEINEFNNRPRLTWQDCSESSDFVEEFDIYRSFGGTTKGSRALIFTKIATTSNYYYIDPDVHVGPGDYVYYKIKAINGNKESGFTPSESINYDGIQKNRTEEAILKFSLSQNYPNPFNPTTVIHYQIPHDEYVTLAVYNSLGEKVTDLVASNQLRGTHSVEFKTESLPSGTYIYKLTAGTYTDTKKITLLR